MPRSTLLEKTVTVPSAATASQESSEVLGIRLEDFGARNRKIRSQDCRLRQRARERPEHAEAHHQRAGALEKFSARDRWVCSCRRFSCSPPSCPFPQPPAESRGSREHGCRSGTECWPDLA